MTTLHPQNQHQFSYDDALVSPYSSDYSLSPSDLMSSWDGRFDNSLQLAVHLEHPNYSQHHAGLSNTVDSARWTADYSSVGSNAYLPCPPVGAASVAGAVDLALQQNPSATVGDFLNHLPVHDIHTSPTTSQRRLSIDEQVNGTGEFDGTKIAAFPATLLQLLDDDNYNDCLCWDSSGHGLIVCNASPRLLQEVLPANFKHNNINSFTRQLNVYGFKRMSQAELADRLDTTATSNYSGWGHPHFLRDDRSMVHQLTPKPSRARLQKKMEKQARLDQEEKTRRESIHGSGNSALHRGGGGRFGRGTSGRSGSGSSSGSSMDEWNYSR